MRLALIPPAAILLLLPVAPVALAGPAASTDPAQNSAGEVRVTAVVRGPSGRLTFRQNHAADAAAGRHLAAQWRSESDVVAADVDHRVHVSTDPLVPQQWALSTLRAGEVGTATGQVVAVVDTGVDATHPDLSGVVLPGVDIVDGYGDGRVDPNGHGTHVAGIVAAVADNGIGGAGLAQGAQLLPIRVMAADGTGYDGDAAKGVVWAADHGATVVNLSLGGPDRSTVMDSAVNYALGKGVTVVVAAGNDGANGNPVQWPAANPGVIAVGAVDSGGAHPDWSETGSYVAVVAPGVNILSTVPLALSSSGYASWSGTSMATPFVSAAAALVRHALPTVTGSGVRNRLMGTADDLGAAGFDPTYGAGRINVVAAEGGSVTAAAPVATADPAASASAAPVASPSATATAAPTAAPTATPAPVSVVAPVMTARISASRTTAPYGGAVTVTGRVLADGLGTAGIPVRLDRLVGGSWVQTRTGTSAAGGLASWVLRPTATTYYRFAGSGWTSPSLRIVVKPVVSLTARTTAVYGRVLPAAGATYVRIDVHRSTGWVTLTRSIRAASDGTYRWSHAFAAGSYLRAVVSGVVSPTARAY